MSALSAAGLIQMWEQAQACAPARRDLLLLAWALPGEDIATLGQFDAALRDWHLLELRRRLFGARIEALAECPECGTTLELALDASQLQDARPPPPAPCHTATDGQRWRLPSCLDLAAAATCHTVEDAAQLLLRRSAGIDEYAPLPAASDAAEAALAALAAERACRLVLHCEACAREWQLDFEPGALLWQEIRARVAGLLDEVHALACAYGWRERDILALSATRRAAYLARVN